MSNFFNDLVSEEDYLGYLPYIEAFSYILNNHNTLISPPFVFGIHGKWGTGKSTFMKLINKKLENKFYTIEINPWEYGDDQNFTTIFLAKLYNKVKKKRLLEGKNSGNNFIKAIFDPLKLSLNTQMLKLEYDFSKFSLDEQKKVIESFVSENFALKESINDLLDEKFFETKKVVVFVDDLDRCSIDRIMQVIESIKLLFNSPNCIFFLACDTSYLEGAISSKHKDFINFAIKDEEKEMVKKNFSREYLEKIIQIPFYIPPITKDNIKEYVKSTLSSKKIPPKKINIHEGGLFKTFIEELGDSFISEMIVVADLNPRRIKRILNLIFLNYTFMRFKNSDELNFKIDIKLSSLLVIIREVYPEYYRVKLSNENDCEKTFKKFFQQFLSEEESKYNTEEDVQSYPDKDERPTATTIKNDQGNIFELFKIYFEFGKINKNKLSKQLKNIIQYISVSSLMIDGNYETLKWGDIGELKADTNGKKLKIFLDKVYSNEPAKEIVLWFFESIFINNRKKYAFGLVKNIPVYAKDDYGKFNYKEDLLFRFDFQEDNNTLFINFQGKGDIKSVLTDVEKNISTKKYDFNDKKIRIDTNTTEMEIKEIKDNIKAILKIDNIDIDLEQIASTAWIDKNNE